MKEETEKEIRKNAERFSRCQRLYKQLTNEEKKVFNKTGKIKRIRDNEEVSKK